MTEQKQPAAETKKPRRFSRRLQAFRQRLQRDALLAVLPILLIFVAYELNEFSQVRKNMTRTHIQQTLDQTERAFRMLVGEIIQNTLVEIAHWGTQGEIDLTDTPALNARFLPIVRRFPYISSLTIANDAGEEYLLHDDGLIWQTRSLTPGSDAVWQRWDGLTTLKDEWSEANSYDPREQPWFQGAAAAGENSLYWLLPSKVLPNTDTSAQGLSGAIRWTQGENIYVAAIHTNLQHFFTLLSILNGNTQSAIFVMTGEEQFLIYSTERSPFTDHPPEAPVSTATEQLVRTELEHVALDWQDQALDRPAFAQFTLNDTAWWAGAKAIPLNQQTFRFGIAMPEEGALPEIQREKRFLLWKIISSSLVMLLLLAVQIRFFLKSFREIERQRKIFVEESRSDLRRLLQQGESASLEFKSTIRWNLKTNKPGKEIELAWLKTVAAYLNTKGGKILLGVRDDGEPLGLDADNFKNDDKLLLHVNNLIKQHIGVEFAHLISAELHTLDERKILMITCEPSKEPVFLKQNSDEQFYIRTGPSSIKLSISEVLKYLEQRQSS